VPAPTLTHADAMVQRIHNEIEERNALIQGIAQDALAADGGKGRDLSPAELEQTNRAQARIIELQEQLEPMRKASRTALESRQRVQEVNAEIEVMRRGAFVGSGIEYRSAGEYIADVYAAAMSDQEAAHRIEAFNRAAAHQTTADNPGLLPQRIIEPVLNEVDEARPLVSAIGPQNLGEGSYAYARVTQHTLVGAQSAEKAELPSRNMQVTLTPLTAPTYGGYVNVSRQNIRRTGGTITNMVISDLAGQYAIQTEDACGDDLVAAATAGTIEIPATPTALGISMAVWGAVGEAARGLRAANIPARRPILAVSADRMALIGPLFPSINPQNAASTGFVASDLTLPGPQGNLAGVTVVMAPGLADETVLFFYGSAVRVFEDRYGALTVDEPSVVGMQVGYAGDFETVIYEADGIISIAQAS